MYKFAFVSSLAIALSASALGYVLYNQNQEQKAEIILLEQASRSSQDAINMLTTQQQVRDNTIKNLMVSLDESRVALTNLQKTLQTHNLTKLAEQRPDTIERLINDATTETFDTIRQLTAR